MKQKTTDFVERFVVDEAMLAEEKFALHISPNGYMDCMPRIARTGIQEYRGIEMGRPDLEKVRVYRPEREVFSKDAVRSLARKPVTIEHPDVPVTSDNWKDFAVGHIGDEVMRDGEFIRVPLHLMDAKADRRGEERSIAIVGRLLRRDRVGRRRHARAARSTTPSKLPFVPTTSRSPIPRAVDLNCVWGINRRRHMATRTIMMDGIHG